jgi:hypothetical protein
MTDQQAGHGKRVEVALQCWIEGCRHSFNSAMISPSSSVPTSANPKLA